MSNPSVRAPVPGLDRASAKTGISTLSAGIPERLISAMSSSRNRIGEKPQA